MISREFFCTNFFLLKKKKKERKKKEKRKYSVYLISNISMTDLFVSVIARGESKKEGKGKEKKRREITWNLKTRYFVAFNLNICFIFICKSRSLFICPLTYTSTRIHHLFVVFSLFFFSFFFPFSPLFTYARDQTFAQGSWSALVKIFVCIVHKLLLVITYQSHV